jgi:hypothetical protein
MAADRPTKIETIQAIDFEYGLDEAPLSDVIAFSRANVTGTDTYGDPLLDSDFQIDGGLSSEEWTALTTAHQGGTEGSYPLTFRTPTGITTTINVTYKVTLKEPPQPKPITPLPPPKAPETKSVKPGPSRSAATDNFLVANQGLAPLVNFNFVLRVEAAFDLPCKSVKAFTRENEYELIQEGGLNDYVHMRRKPISKPFTLDVERYVAVDYFDPLPNGSEPVLPILLIVTRNLNSTTFSSPWVRTYTFTGCTVIKKTYGELNAEQSGLLVETTTIAYREMVCLDLPLGSV